jgi:hypothetical protein
VCIDVGIEQTVRSDTLLMLLSVAKTRFMDSLGDKSDGPLGVPAYEEQEIEPLISVLARSQTRHCAELPPPLGRDIHIMKGQNLQDGHLTAETVLSELTESLGL